MSKIPDDILETLICTECACYLSHGPICLKIEGGPVCGRCQVPDNSYVTDTPYENLAKMMNFPCRYKKDGCKDEFKFGDVTFHEDDCDYRECFCPVITDGSCEWKGTVIQLLEHVENNHNDKLLKHPCVVPHSFSENQTNIYITSMQGYLYLIHFEFLVSTRKIRHWVRTLSNKEYAQVYDFNLSIESPDKKNIQQNEIVLPFENESEVAVVTSVNVLQEFFGSLEDLKFVVTIYFCRNNRCSTCEGLIKKVVYLSGDEYKCEKCLPAVTTCGTCHTYQDFETKVDKHQTYFCNGANRCINCPVSIFGQSNYDNLQEHIKNEHPTFYHNSNTFKSVGISGNVSAFQLSLPSTTKQELHVINTEIGHIFCEFHRTYNSLTVNIYAPLANNDLNNYNCCLEMFHPQNTSSIHMNIQRENGLNPDWTLKNHLRESDLKNEVDIKITFPKRDIYKQELPL